LALCERQNEKRLENKVPRFLSLSKGCRPP